MASRDSAICPSGHLTQDLNEYVFWMVCLGVRAAGRKEKKTRELQEMSSSLGQKSNNGWVLYVCICGMLFLEGKDEEVDTNRSRFTEPPALWRPEGHEVKRHCTGHFHRCIQDPSGQQRMPGSRTESVRGFLHDGSTLWPEMLCDLRIAAKKRKGGERVSSAQGASHPHWITR